MRRSAGIAMAFVLAAVWMALPACEKKEEAKKAPDIVEQLREARKAAQKTDEPMTAERFATRLRWLNKEDQGWAGDPACVGPVAVAGAQTQTRTVGPLTFTQEGAALSITGPQPLAELKLGVISDIKNATPGTMKNVAAFVAEFQKNQAFGIVVAGDLSEKKADIAQVLEAVAKSGLPVFTVQGNRESKPDYADAHAALAPKYPNLVDMNKVRIVNTDVVTLVSVPGYYDQNFIPENGCQYVAADVAALFEPVKAARHPVALISHGPPKTEVQSGIDFAVNAGNVGDPMLTELINTLSIQFGIFGNIMEAGGKAMGTGLKGFVKENETVDRLYLNAGPADADPWQMLDGTVSTGMAGLVAFGKGTASYTILRQGAAAAPAPVEGK